MKKILALLICLGLLTVPAEAAIRWVDFGLSCEAMERALELEIRSREQENPHSWIEILALAAAQHNGTPTATEVTTAWNSLMDGKSPQEILGDDRYYRYWLEAYTAVLDGLVGSYAVEVDGEWRHAYGVKAFSPIADGYWYTHSDDFGASRSYGYQRRHLGHDMMGGLGTPIVAVESGTVEALGWNQYGGWRVGIRSDDRKRYYYYAHLRKDTPYASGLQEGDRVEAGQVIGFMGRSGYSKTENVDNIETVHLHFGMQLIFEEWQKECNSEIWIDVYEITRFLSRHRSTVLYNAEKDRWERLYSYVDRDSPEIQ